jgi:hypothetical protein
VAAGNPFSAGDAPWVPTSGGGGATGGPAADVSGVGPAGGAVHIAVTGTPRVTLLAFLTSGCATCGNFWDVLSTPGGLQLPAYVDRLVVVTRGVDRESPAQVAARAPRGRADVAVVMSSDAWSDYQVPVSPYFVLVEGSSGRVAGEGAAGSWPQLESLLARAAADNQPIDTTTRLDAGRGEGDVGADGRPQRERADEALARAGIDVGHPSLFGER